MGYLLTEIVLYLVIAGFIGFVFGWFVRDGRFKKSTKPKEDVVPDTNNEEKVIEKVVAEVIKEEVKEIVIEAVVATTEKSRKPTLLSQAPEGGADKLSTIKGIGPVIEKKLNTLGIYTFEQIASWGTEEEIWIVKQLEFPISISKEAWAKQAKELVNAK